MNTALTTNTGTIRFSLQKVMWMYFIFLPICFINFSQINMSTVLLTIGITILTVGIGHSVGLHRGVIHKSYTSSKMFRKAALYLFVLNGMGSPLSWLKQHYFRDYWQNRKDCPRYFRYQHSLLTDFWWNLHFTYTPNNIDLYKIPKEDLKDPWVLWLHKTWYLHNLTFIIVVWLLTDFNTMLCATFLRSSCIILGHWYIGYASHKYGYARHEIKEADESGFNDVLLGLISFGEGFHNNHHSYPNSAKFSSRWYEIDLGWSLVWLLKKLHIIHQVKTQDKTLKNSAKKHQNIHWKFPF